MDCLYTVGTGDDRSWQTTASNGRRTYVVHVYDRDVSVGEIDEPDERLTLEERRAIERHERRAWWRELCALCRRLSGRLRCAGRDVMARRKARPVPVRPRARFDTRCDRRHVRR